MLVSLHIENIAVIEAADIDFGSGFCVLTGETGAGKSILIDSINAVLGERTSKELIRTGCERANVRAVFSDISQGVQKKLADYGVAADNELIISRTLTDSKSVVKLNGQTLTAAVIRDIAQMLINIHGQHDSHALLDPERHYIYIDELAKNEALLSEYGNAFSQMQATRHKLQSLLKQIDDRERRRELLTHQINELTAADIQVGEIELLKQKQLAAEHLQAIQKALQKTVIALGGADDDTGGAVSLCDDAMASLTTVAPYSSSASTLADGLSELIDNITELKSQAEQQLFAIDLDKNEPEEISDRLDMYFRFRGKYGDNEQKMLDFLQNAKNELSQIEDNDAQTVQLQKLLGEQVEQVKRLGTELSRSRKTAGERFSADVAAQLAFLDMPDVKIEVSIQSAAYSRIGADKIEFLISTNPGEPLKPLYKIASGGEMSRIMLAIKNVLAQNDPVGTLIFDEIDAGISGRAALKVGQKLKEVSAAGQVICVTHLAQIAAMANEHLLIEKQLSHGRATTKITLLDFDGRRRELARIIGSDTTETNLKSAEEMLRLYS